jgi:hypothetical protein
MLPPRANVIKLFTAVIYHHFTIIPSFCVIELYYLGNYYGVAINNRGILTQEKVGLEFIAVLFYNIGPWWQKLAADFPSLIRT